MLSIFQIIRYTDSGWGSQDQTLLEGSGGAWGQCAPMMTLLLLFHTGHPWVRTVMATFLWFGTDIQFPGSWEQAVTSRL